MNEQVVIVGAGPTGLVLALFLSKLGVRPRIVDEHSGPGEASRAMVVQARTLEFYRQIGIADEVVHAGIMLEHLVMREGDKIAANLPIREIGAQLSPYPGPLSYPQDDHERLLVDKLKAEGVEVEWNTELTSFEQTEDAVHIQLNRDKREILVQAEYLCGCDGAHSRVRSTLGLGFPGGTYDQTFFVADVAVVEENRSPKDLQINLGHDAFVIAFPIRSTEMTRLIGIVPDQIRDREDITFEDVRGLVEERISTHVEQVNWFSRYRVHHRVAEHFRSGRAFIAGDAGHIHSPAGGQGMNTGIGDAVNLAWKLAAVLQNRASSELLDSYEPERIAFAHSLVESTDRMFKFMVGRDKKSDLLRTVVVPHVAPLLFGFAPTRRLFFEFVSQIRINYRDSVLSQGSAGALHAGDRLPYVDSVDNFAPLRSLDWQVHVYGTASDQLRSTAGELGLKLTEFAWTDDAHDCGLERNAMYFVRPDGHIAIADGHQNVDRLREYVSRVQIRARN